MGFAEGRIAEEKVVGDVVFPKTLLPPPDTGESGAPCDLAEMVKEEGASLSETLRRHGAILFRGFPVHSGQDFGRVVEASGWEDMDFITASTRVKIADRVFTANEAPLDKFINFHHEMALAKVPPTKIFFCCLEAPPEGGETAILPSHVLAEKMEEQLPEFVAKLAEVGFVFRIGTVKDELSDSSELVINRTWKGMLQTDDRVEAEKRAMQLLSCSSVEFKSDGSAEFAYGPTNPVREFGGKRVWFVPILGYTSNEEDVRNSFADGSAFPREVPAVFKRILEENCVDLKWQNGDVLLLDNLQVQHARRPGKPPRVVCASICK